MTLKQHTCKVGEPAFVFLYTQAQEKLIEETIKDYQLLHPNTHFECQQAQLPDSNGDMVLKFIARVDNPFIDTEGFINLLNPRSGLTKQLITGTCQAKCDTVVFLSTAGGNKAWQISVIEKALDYVKRFSHEFWDVANTWSVAKIYFFPDLKIEISENFSFPQMLLKQRLQKDTFDQVSLDVQSGLHFRNEHELDLIWLSLVLAEAEMYIETLAQAIEQPDVEALETKEADAVIFSAEKFKQIVLFEAHDVGLWGLAFEKLNKLAVVAHCKM